jgi:MFS family permease
VTSAGGSTVAEGRRQTIAYAVLLALAALDASGYSIIAPVAPVVARTTHAGPALVGTLVAVFPLGMMLGFAAFGRQVGRRRTGGMLYAGLALVGTGSLGFVLGHSLGVYFAGRILMGIGSGGLWMGITTSMLERWPGQEYLCMSRVFAAYSAGGLVGPLLGAIGGIRGPFLAFALLVLAGSPLVALLGEPRERRELTADRAALRLPGFWFASAGISFAVLALGVIEGVLPLHFATHLSQTEIGGFYAATSIVIAAAAAAGARFRPQPLLLTAILLVVAGLAVAGATSVVAVWIVALVCAGVGIGAGNTASTGILLESVGPERIVTGLVVWSQLGMAGYLLGPLAGGGIAETIGFGAVVIVPLAAATLVLAAYLWARSSSQAVTKG